MIAHARECCIRALRIQPQLYIGMSKRPILRVATTSTSLRYNEGPPIFLAPLLASGNCSSHKTTQFSTSSPLLKRRKMQKRDSNPNRGVSALRRTGLRHPVSMSKVPLPQPVLDPAKRSKPTVDESHGLWGFFNEQRTTLSTPEEDNSHGMGLSALPSGVGSLIHLS